MLCLVAALCSCSAPVPPLLAAADAPARSSPALVLPLATIGPRVAARAAAAGLLVTLGASVQVLRLGPARDLDAAQREPGRGLRVGTDLLGDADVAAGHLGQAALLRGATGARCPAPAAERLVGGLRFGGPGAPTQLVASTPPARAALRGGTGRRHLVRGRRQASRRRTRSGARTVAAPSLGHGSRRTASNGVGVGAVPRLVVQTPVRPADRLRGGAGALRRPRAPGLFWPTAAPEAAS